MYKLTIVVCVILWSTESFSFEFKGIDDIDSISHQVNDLKATYHNDMLFESGFVTLEFENTMFNNLKQKLASQIIEDAQRERVNEMIATKVVSDQELLENTRAAYKFQVHNMDRAEVLELELDAKA